MTTLAGSLKELNQQNGSFYEQASIPSNFIIIEPNFRSTSPYFQPATVPAAS
jgi:hypothetical protein